MLDRTAIRTFLTTYGDALASGDLDGIAASYAYPSHIVGDAGSVPVAAPDEVREAFRGAAEKHHAQGLVGARPALVAVEELSDAVASADVRWSYTDRDGAEADSNSFRYLLRDAGDGIRICVVVQVTAAPARHPG